RGDLDGDTLITLHDEDKARGAISVRSDWWPGEALWEGSVGGKRVSVQVRPVLNGYDLAYAGVSARAYTFTLREAELAALMPEKKAADTSKKLLCPMPGLVISIAVAEGQEVKA